ncbi:ataxin-2 homolog [Drosophila obscura]|uniref:ataxin-2 homolog n=1 Tax=Drosophila obscura TaxID=7282 RepID=UPI001BB212AE|nr:ataxin-2 homolog [Drosophila obscura]
MRIQIWVLTLLLGLLCAQALETKAKSDSTSSIDDSKSAASTPLESEASKDKRQVSSKETPLYPNHRSADAAAADDPEDGQETIYGTKPNQFIIRPIAPHQHQQHEGHQEPQLRNFAAANSRPHAAQLLEQSQEVQHYVYLQDIMRHHQPKALGASGQGKGAASNPKKSSTPVAEEEQEQEAEQRYAVSIQPQPQLQLQQRPRPYPGVGPYQLPLPLPAPQHQQGHPQQQQQHQAQQPYQVIPEEQFLKLLEEELQARAYHEQLRQQQQQQQQHHHQQQQQHPQQQAQYQQQKQLSIHSTAATHKVLQQAEPSLGLGGYRDRLVAEQELVSPAYSQSQSRGGPKYLPLSQAQQFEEEEVAAQQQQQQHQQQQQQAQRSHLHKPIQHQGQPHQQQLISGLPPQIAYYQPQISYKTLPNHPLAKSSLESEIEKLLAANKPGPALAYVDSSNEPSYSHQQQSARHPLPLQHPPPPTSHPALRQPKAYLASTPNSLLDANNQPFVPSLFKFSNYQQPTPIYPTQAAPIPEPKRLGPVVYPTQTANQPQPSQYYYQEASPTAGPKPSPHPKPYLRSKHYKLAAPTKGLLYADYDRSQGPPPPQSASSSFYPSPPDPIKHAQRTLGVTPTSLPLPDYPSPSPSQSSIYVSQGTGIATPSRATPTGTPVQKLRTLDEVKQLNLPPPNGKPLTQAEFQALVDAGYPVKAVPVPVPVPYEQYVKDHPEYRNHPPVDYVHLMRLATRQLATQQQHHQHHRSLAAPSEPSLKIISSPTASDLQQQTATGIGGGSVTYLQPIEGQQGHLHAHAHALQKRRPRDEQDTAVAGSETKAAAPESKARSQAAEKAQ